MNLPSVYESRALFLDPLDSSSELQRMGHCPREKDKRVPQFSPNAAVRNVSGMETAEVTVIKETDVPLSPIERCFYGRPPCSRKPYIERDSEAMFWSIPYFSW